MQPTRLDDIEHSILNWVGDFSLEEVEFDHNEELMSCVCESFCIGYEPEYDMFAFDDQCDDLLLASLLTSIYALSSSSYEAPPSVLSSSSLGLKPFLIH